jgi:hypothetical protein
VSAVIPPDLLTVEVTAEDIRKGTRCESADCAIAVAARRILWVIFASAEIDRLTVSFRDEDGLIRPVYYELPESVNNFIVYYDNGMYVEPFTFTAKRVNS